MMKMISRYKVFLLLALANIIIGLIMPDFDATYGIGYAGVWASNVDFGADDPTAEIDLYAGVRPTIGDTSLDLGVLYYGYVEDKGIPGSYSYVELKAAASRT